MDSAETVIAVDVAVAVAVAVAMEEDVLDNGSTRVKTDLSLEARRIIKASTKQDALLKTRQFHWNWHYSNVDAMEFF